MRRQKEAEAAASRTLPLSPGNQAAEAASPCGKDHHDQSRDYPKCKESSAACGGQQDLADRVGRKSRQNGQESLRRCKFSGCNKGGNGYRSRVCVRETGNGRGNDNANFAELIAEHRACDENDGKRCRQTRMQSKGSTDDHFVFRVRDCLSECQKGEHRSIDKRSHAGANSRSSQGSYRVGNLVVPRTIAIWITVASVDNTAPEPRRRSSRSVWQRARPLQQWLRYLK